MKDTTELTNIIHRCLENTSSELGVSASYLSSCAIKEVDPDNRAPELVRWGCVLQFRQIARKVLRDEYEPSNDRLDSQQEMFEKLQERYPVNRNDKNEYLPRIKMTIEERRETADKFRKISRAYNEHADAFDTETDELIESGFFDQPASK